MVFDLDIKDLHTQFKSCYVDYLKLAVPELGLIQTSLAGDMHGRLLFKKPISVENAKRYYQFLRDFPYADGASSFTMPHVNSKRGDFTVKELKPPEKVAKEYLDDLLRPIDY